MLTDIKNSIIISIQSTEGDPTHFEEIKTAYMKSAIQGGARGFRLADEADIKNAKKLFPDIAVIGITKPKKIPENYKELVYITPSVQDAQKVISWGADIIAFDGTKRHDYTPILTEIHMRNKIAMADISTLDEAIAAREAGADIISTTLSGYTSYSKQSEEPDFDLLQSCVKNLDCPVIMEGKIWERRQVKYAFELGAGSVVIGSAVTRPWLITERFVNYGK